MRILHVLASNSFSGAENVVCQIVEMFKGEHDYEMAYCSPNGSISKVLENLDIKYFPLKSLCIKELRRVIKTYNPNIVHAHDFRASIISTQCTKNKIISHLHNNSPWLKKHGLKSFLFNITCKKYSRILTVSNSVFDEFVYGYKHKNKVFVLGNPINTKKIKEKADEKDINEIFDIGFCGRITPQKNLYLFLDIVKNISEKIPSIKVAVIGDGELKDKFIDEIKVRGLDNIITMFGFQCNPYPIIKNFKLLLMPSLWEGFGLVAVEALTLGVPVVCSGVGGLKDIVTDECGKKCACIDDYIKEIVELLTDNDYLKQKRCSAIVRSKELDNIIEYSKSLKDIYYLI